MSGPKTRGLTDVFDSRPAHDGRMEPKTIRIATECSLPPARVLAAAVDFSEHRPEIWPNVSTALMTVHDLGSTSADVTEGTRQGPLYAWERCLYDWSTAGSVTATVIDSNVYASPGSTWQIRATPHEQGSSVEMTWVRTFKRSAMGLFLGTMYRTLGGRLFKHDVEKVIGNLEAAAASSRVTGPGSSTAS